MANIRASWKVWNTSLDVLRCIFHLSDCLGTVCIYAILALLIFLLDRLWLELNRLKALMGMPVDTCQSIMFPTPPSVSPISIILMTFWTHTPSACCTHLPYHPQHMQNATPASLLPIFLKPWGSSTPLPPKMNCLVYDDVPDPWHFKYLPGLRSFFTFNSLPYYCYALIGESLTSPYTYLVLCVVHIPTLIMNSM